MQVGNQAERNPEIGNQEKETRTGNPVRKPEIGNHRFEIRKGIQE